MRAPFWEEWELDVIRRRDLTVKQQMALLPGRTESAIRTRRVEMGVHATGKTPPGRWKPHEGRVVRENPHLSCKALAELLPGRTEGAISIYRNRTLGEVRQRQWHGRDEG